MGNSWGSGEDLRQHQLRARWMELASIPQQTCSLTKIKSDGFHQKAILMHCALSICESMCMLSHTSQIQFLPIQRSYPLLHS